MKMTIGQHLKREDDTERTGLVAQRSEEKLAARFGVLEQRIHRDRCDLKQLAEVGLQNQKGKAELQAKSPEQDAGLDRPPVV